jgi:hypothetical protein
MDMMTQVRLDLKAAGYSPIPLTGKIPVTAGWPSMDSDEESICAWTTRYPFAANTGIITKFTPTIDGDITDAGASRDVCDLAREFFHDGTFCARVGKAPKFAMLLRSDLALKKVKVSFVAPDGGQHHIEILGDGQQMVAFGRHPETKRPYHWNAGGPGHAAPRNSLPLTTDERNAQFLAAVTDMLANKHGWRVKVSKPKTSSGNGAPRGGSGGGGGGSMLGLIRTVISAVDGERNSVTFWAACRVGEMVVAGDISESQAIAELVAAAGHVGLPQHEALRTIESGLKTAGAVL